METRGFSAAERLERLPVSGYHRIIFIIIALAFFFDSMVLAMMSFLLGSIKTEFGLSTAQAGDALHPVQEAWIEQQVPQCGICQFGMMIKVTELLEANPAPSDAQIREALTTSGPSPHLCRCGSYAAILEGAQHAARLMAQGRAS